MNNGIGKAASIMVKILEVGHWVSAVLMAVAGVLSLVAPQWLKYVMDVESLAVDGKLSAYGLEVIAKVPSGELHTTVLCLFAVGATAIFVLVALIFRWLYLLIKQAEKATPFCAENVSRLKKIGISCIVVPLIGFVMSGIIQLVAGGYYAEVYMDQTGAIMGIIILCLTQYFARGAQLENDVDGLL
ncbi:MAG: DUF2975 domain-containing protein [Clostridia bacterium]|nr:DUF2975 domain-containing protein [Clostridia bacterium]